MDDVQKLNEAWQKEGSLIRLGLRGAADPAILKAIIPPGGEWVCVAPDGAITRSVMWNDTEVCLVNSRGDMTDSTEASIAMGLRATPALDKAMRAIFVLASDSENLDLIQRIARAAVVYIEMPAPDFSEGADEP